MTSKLTAKKESDSLLYWINEHIEWFKKNADFNANQVVTLQVLSSFLIFMVNSFVEDNFKDDECKKD
jgi:hypothetical protein